ncbi:putative Insecticidal toxin protein, partial [Pseudomonas syringae pv. maculicola]
MRLKSSLTTAPNGGETWWNCLGHQNTITDMTGALQPVLNLNASSITLSTALNNDIRGDDYLEVLLTFRVERRSWALKLIVEPDYLTTTFATLKSGSTLSISTTESVAGKINFTLVTSDATDDNMFDFLLDENFQNYRISGTAQVKNIENGKCKSGVISALLYNQA